MLGVTGTINQPELGSLQPTTDQADATVAFLWTLSDKASGTVLGMNVASGQVIG